MTAPALEERSACRHPVGMGRRGGGEAPARSPCPGEGPCSSCFFKPLPLVRHAATCVACFSCPPLSWAATRVACLGPGPGVGRCSCARHGRPWAGASQGPGSGVVGGVRRRGLRPGARQGQGGGTRRPGGTGGACARRVRHKTGGLAATSAAIGSAERDLAGRARKPAQNGRPGSSAAALVRLSGGDKAYALCIVRACGCGCACAFVLMWV